MKIKHIVCCLLLVVIAVGLCACSKNKKPDEQEELPRSSYQYTASIEIDGDLVRRDDVIELKNESYKNKLVVEAVDGPFVLGMMVFNNGMPISYTIDHIEYTYYPFEAGKRSTVNFSIDANKLQNEKSKISVVLVTNHDYFPQFSRDDDKNYSMTMDYWVNNISGASNTQPGSDEYDKVQHISLTDYFNVCKNKYIQSYPEMRKYDFTYEEETLYRTSESDLDIVFTEAFDLENNTGLSVYRFTSQYPESGKEMLMRITGKPGTYTLTIFDNGFAYGGFNGNTTITFTIHDKEMIVIPVQLPEWKDMGYSKIYALAFSSDTQTHRVYDSANCIVYYTQQNINLYMNQTRTYTNLLYEGELVQSNHIVVTGNVLNFTLVVNQEVSSYFNDYMLLILVNGKPHTYQIGNADFDLCSYNCVDGPARFDVTLALDNEQMKEPATVDFILLQNYANSTFEVYNLGTSMLQKISVNCYLNGANIPPEKEPEVDGDESNDVNETPEPRIDFDISNKDVLACDGYLIPVEIVDEYTATVEISNMDCDAVSGFICVNDELIHLDPNTRAEKNDVTNTFTVVIPRKLLHGGMNGIHIVVTDNSTNATYENVKAVYIAEARNESIKLNIQGNVVFVDSPESYSTIFVSMGAKYSHYTSMFGCVTPRQSLFANESKDSMVSSWGNDDTDNRFVIKMIVSATGFDGKKYTFTKTDMVGQTY